MAYHIQYHDHAGKELMGSDGGTIYHGKTVGGAAKHARGVMESRKVTYAKNFPRSIPHGFSIRSNEGQEKYSQNPRILHAEGSAKAKPSGASFSATDDFAAAHAEFAAVAAPKKAPAHDPAAVRELTLHADNTQKLYNNERYIHASMMHKHDKGTYNHDLAHKAYKHHADAAAAHYTKEYGTKGPHGSFGVFSPADRAAAARHYADQNHPAETTAVDDPRRDNHGPTYAVNAFKKKHGENFSATPDTFSAAHAEFAAETDTFSAKVSGNTAKLDHMYEGDGHRKLAEKAPKGSHLRDYHASMARYHFQKLSGGSVSHDKRNAAAALRAHKNSETATGERKADTFAAAHGEFAAMDCGGYAALPKSDGPFTHSKVKVLGLGRDTNGNKLVKVGHSGGSFTIQTNGNIPTAHRHTGKVDPESHGKIMDEVHAHVSSYGTDRQKKILGIK